MNKFLLAASVVILVSAANASENLKTSDKNIAPIRANQVLMQKKLLHAQGLMRGLALEDFPGLERDSKELSVIATASNWYNTDSPTYQRYFQNFQESLKFMQDNANQKNLEGVAMGFVRITLTCMQCHNFVRDTKSRK